MLGIKIFKCKPEDDPYPERSPAVKRIDRKTQLTNQLRELNKQLSAKTHERMDAISKIQSERAAKLSQEEGELTARIIAIRREIKDIMSGKQRILNAKRIRHEQAQTRKMQILRDRKVVKMINDISEYQRKFGGKNNE